MQRPPAAAFGRLSGFQARNDGLAPVRYNYIERVDRAASRPGRGPTRGSVSRVFILYAVLIGLVLGFVLGGRLSGLATVDFHWPWLAIGGFVVQLLLFADPVSSVVGSLGPPLYVASTGAVLVAVIRNIRIPGMALVAVGAGANLAAIVANGGFMPASEAAFAALGSGLSAGYTNSSIVADPALEPLTDVYSLPAWLPFANVFSIGDVFIAIGVVIVIVSGMRSWRVALTAQPEPQAAAEVPAPAPRPPPGTKRRWRFLPPNRPRS